MAERCVCCGESIPEGRQVCPNCENAPLREKLVELVHDGEQQCSKILCKGCEHFVQLAKCKANIITDHLIANGVRLEEKQATSNASEQFASDNHVGGKWIPVTEDLPKLIPCDAGTAYSEAVNVMTSGRKVLTAIWDGFDWICDAEYWDAEDEEITHWTPVLLPLPEPPKD